VNEIASVKNWHGAYAELAAYDYLHTEKNWVNPPIELNKDLDGASTYAREVGKTGPANHDVSFPSFKIVTDVKCLKDNVATTASRIITIAFRRARRPPTPARRAELRSCRLRRGVLLARPFP